MSSIEERKKLHLDACFTPAVRGNGAGLEHIQLPYDALFEVSDEKLNTKTRIAGIELDFPLMIGAMTGGTVFATSFNNCLRSLAQRYHIALCLGSMRALLNNPDLIETYGAGEVDALFANIGASEITVYTPQQMEENCKRLGAKGLFIHLNGLQEWVQDGGNHDFSMTLDALARFVEKFKMPVFIKEVGSGIGGKCAKKLASLPIAGIETASRGGTSWIKIEAALSQHAYAPEDIEALNCVGYTLEQSIRDCASCLRPHQTLIASGGIAQPLEIVQSLALGAHLVAIAQPLYAAWNDGGAEKLEARIEAFIRLGRRIWRSTGCADLAALNACTLYPQR